jgi:hypothetical protein
MAALMKVARESGEMSWWGCEGVRGVGGVERVAAGEGGGVRRDCFELRDEEVGERRARERGLLVVLEATRERE